MRRHMTRALIFALTLTGCATAPRPIGEGSEG